MSPAWAFAEGGAASGSREQKGKPRKRQWSSSAHLRNLVLQPNRLKCENGNVRTLILPPAHPVCPRANLVTVPVKPHSGRTTGLQGQQKGRRIRSRGPEIPSYDQLACGLGHTPSPSPWTRPPLPPMRRWEPVTVAAFGRNNVGVVKRGVWEPEGLQCESCVCY